MPLATAPTISVPQAFAPPARATISDVARQSGVSISAVSKVMNVPVERSRIHPDTRRRVLDVAERLGYTPNWRARALRQGRSHTVGLLYTQPSPYIRGLQGTLVRQMADLLHAGGYRMQFVPLLGEAKAWRALVIDQQLDGAVVFGSFPPAMADLLAATGTPAVLINADAPGLRVPQVQPDDHAGAVELTGHLLSLGHRRITFFRDASRVENRHISIRRREAGYAEAMAAAGAGAHVRRVVDLPEAMADRVAAGAEDCTAVIVYDEMESFRLLGTLLRRGVSVPGRVSVGTFNDNEVLEHVCPSVTTVRLPAEAMCRAGVEKLIGWIEGGWKPPVAGPPPRQVFGETLVVRESTAPPPPDESAG